MKNKILNLNMGMQPFIHIITLVLCLSITYNGYTSDYNPVVIVDSVNCYGGTDGSIKIIIPGAQHLYTAILYKYSPTGIPLGAKQLNDSTCFEATNLSAGKYLVEIKGTNGFTLTRQIEVAQPDKLETEKITVQKKLSDPDAGDAILKAAAKGGTLPYSFNWDIGEGSKLSQVIKNVAQGTYTCIINDANNCGPVKATILFNKHVMPTIIEE